MKHQRPETITSTKNPKVKDAIGLMDRRRRDQTGLMLIEGVKELRLAVKGKVSLIRLFYCEELFRDDEVNVLAESVKRGAEPVPVNARVFEKMAYREDSGGLIAVARQPARTLNDLLLGKTPLLVVVEGIEKPGNLGAVLRSADAAGVDGIIVCGRSTDLFNPNVVRASIGTVFTVPVVEATVPDTISWLRNNGIRIIATTPRTENIYFDSDLRKPSAIIMGSEHEGLSDRWFKEADLLVRIPMKGEADSLNLATAATILLYEAVRQRTKS